MLGKWFDCWCYNLFCTSIDGHYLNLPIREENQPIIGLVDVLKLTYATLEQVSKAR
jgi:hypothetical protein